MKKTAPLPKDRIKPAPPFTNVGLNFAGPLFLKDSGEKAYICLFTCAVTRAIHLELVSNMHDCGAVSPCLKTNGGKKRNVQYYLIR